MFPPQRTAADPDRRSATRTLTLFVAVLTAAVGCFETRADREVYRLIEQRQMAALGQTSEVRLSQQPVANRTDPYSFVPHPTDMEVPEAFRKAAEPPAEDGAAGPPLMVDDAAGPMAAEALDEPLAGPEGEPWPLTRVLGYAFHNAREYQDAKEDLYLQGLALSLERFLWTPRFMSNLQATYTEFPKDSDPDRAMAATANVAVEQRLPYGGTVVAQWIGTMIRDLENHVTNSESGTAILEADIPLLRGAGRVAYESRYQSERNLIYAVRQFERFRRTFVTAVASRYFNLLNLKSNIRNALANRESSLENWRRSRALADADRLIMLDADRAQVDYLQAANRVVLARESYGTALDEFKILIGMPTIQQIDVVDEGLDLMQLQVDEVTAIDTAVRTRLDLLNVLDSVDDAKRNVQIARNNLLPDLDFSGEVRYDTNPDHLSSADFREDRETWTAGIDLEIPLDRKAERNAYRSSLIGLQRAQRRYDLEVDLVRLEVRRAQRRIEQARFSLRIQEQNIESNEIRRESAEIKFRQGLISNRDFVEAQNDLRNARDDYAQAQAELREAILVFRLNTGTLRIDAEGNWIE